MAHVSGSPGPAASRYRRHGERLLDRRQTRCLPAHCGCGSEVRPIVSLLAVRCTCRRDATAELRCAEPRRTALSVGMVRRRCQGRGRRRAFSRSSTSSGLRPGRRAVAAVGGTGICRPSVAELTDFVTAAAQRYGGGYQGLPRVRYWMLWNEPNLDNYLRPQFEGTQAVSPECVSRDGERDACGAPRGSRRQPVDRGRARAVRRKQQRPLGRNREPGTCASSPVHARDAVHVWGREAASDVQRQDELRHLGSSPVHVRWPDPQRLSQG